MAFVTVRHLYSHPQAYLAKATLEAEEIPAYLADEHIVSVNWLWARAVGGIRLMVAAESVARASEILGRDDSNTLEGIPEWEEPPSRYDCCPSCGSTAVLAARWSRNARALSVWPGWSAFVLPVFVLVALLAVAVARYRCGECGHDWC